MQADTAPSQTGSRHQAPRVAGIIYGPVSSKRFGLSLGINLSGSGKYCSFSCPYCFRGGNDGRPDDPRYLDEIPTRPQVLAALREVVIDRDRKPIGDWTLAGNAEPTDHPELPGIIEDIVELRDMVAPRTLISVLSNGMGLVPGYNENHEEIARALSMVDRACLKLDAGTPLTWRRLSGAAGGVTLESWLDAAQALPSPIVQVMMVRGLIDNTTEEEIRALERCIGRLKAREVQVVTADRQPADGRIQPVARATLSRLAKRLAASAADADDQASIGCAGGG